LSTPKFDTIFEGEGILIVAKETVKDEQPLCLGLGPSKNKVRAYLYLLEIVIGVSS
jgi:hypothetical protein